MGFKKADYIWTDRRRRMGMPLSFTRYALSEDRLFLSTGFLSIKDDEVLLYRIRDIHTKRTLWQRLFGMGTVFIISSDSTQPNLPLKNIKNPMKVKEIIHKQVEQQKKLRRVRVNEIASCNHDDLDDELDDDIDMDDEL